MQHGRQSRRLAELARPLRPYRAPFYVRLPVPPGLETTFPAAGWYWTPAAERPVAVFLGANVETAWMHLHRLLERQEIADEREQTQA